MSGKIILVQDRQDNYHLVDFCASNGRKYTLCELVYNKKTIINTLTVDDLFDGVCDKCKEVYQKEFGGQAVGNRLVKSSLCQSLTRKYSETQGQVSEKELGYMDRADRVWDKLGRYKRELKIDRRK